MIFLPIIDIIALQYKPLFSPQIAFVVCTIHWSSVPLPLFDPPPRYTPSTVSELFASAATASAEFLFGGSNVDKTRHHPALNGPIDAGSTVYRAYTKPHPVRAQVLSAADE